MTRCKGSLAGRVAVITGAGSGIGWAAAKRFAEEGARVVCADISGQERDTAELLGESAVPVRVDVTNAADVQKMIATAIDSFGQVDILLNNAGFGGPHAALADIDEATFDTILAINLKGVFLGMKYAIPAMLQAGGGAVVNTASASGLVGWQGLSCYAAAKAAVVQMTKSAVRINAICPGMTYTGMAGGKPGDDVPPGDYLPTPMARWGEPAELAAAALFLASDEASFVTGAALAVDGGYSASGPLLRGASKRKGP